MICPWEFDHFPYFHPLSCLKFWLPEVSWQIKIRCEFSRATKFRTPRHCTFRNDRVMLAPQAPATRLDLENGKHGPSAGDKHGIRTPATLLNKTTIIRLPQNPMVCHHFPIAPIGSYWSFYLQTPFMILPLISPLNIKSDSTPGENEQKVVDKRGTRVQVSVTYGAFGHLRHL